MAESFEALERELGGRSGAVFSVDGAVAEVGTLRSGAAWSTIKVPLAIAVVAEAGGRPDPEVEELIGLAITESDNDAARALWDRLGSPEAAAAAVERVLAAGGDSETRVETRVVLPPYTPFGQTEWSLAAQQRFAAGLREVRYAEPVLALMRRIVPEQRWGLGAIDGEAAFKGGWGPDPPDPALVRQFGIATAACRTLVAAIANEPEDGSYAIGEANLTRIAEWLVTSVRS